MNTSQSNQNTNQTNPPSSASTVDNFSSDMSMGIRLSSRQDTTQSTRNGRSEVNNLANNILQEEPWSLNNMLERYAFLDTYPWLSSNPSHTVLRKLRVPQDLIKTSISAVPFSSFIYWRGGVEASFQVTSTPLSQGMLAAVFVPLSQTRFIDSTIVPNFTNVSINQCMYLYANTNTSGTMKISFNSPQSYLDLTDPIDTPRSCLGYIYLIVFNRLELAATASDTTSVSVFTRFTNNEFKVPRISTLSSVTSFSVRPQSMAMLGNVAASILTQHKSAPSSGGKSTLRSIASKLLPSSLASDVLDSALGAFGLDKPTDPNLQLPMQVLGTQRMNFVQGVESIDKLSLYPAQTFDVDKETFATDADEMDMNFLKKKYSYLGSFTMSTASPVGSVIASFPINPTPIEIFDNTISQVPLLSYISFPFQYWKGSLSYKVQVVSTSFQTGKIFFAFNIGTYVPAVGLNVNQLTSQYGEAYEINQGSNELEFTVPYLAPTSVLNVPNSNLPNAEDTVGYINIVVLNPLVAPNNTPTSITLNVFIAGGDDFELSVLTQSNNLLPIQPVQLTESREIEDYIFPDSFTPIKSAPITFRARPQSASAPLITPMNEVDLAEETLVAPNTTTTMRKDVTQMSPLTIKNLLKKYQMTSQLITTAGTTTEGGSITVLALSDFFGRQPSGLSLPPSLAQPSYGLWTHFQLLYRQFKGSLRFKVMANNLKDASFSIFYQPPVAYDSGAFAPTAVVDALANSLYIPNPAVTAPGYNGRTTLTRGINMNRLPVSYVNGIQKTAEFEIPYTSRFSSILSWMGSASENELLYSPLVDLGRLIIYCEFSDPAVVDPNLSVFIALGDESRFGNLFQVPNIATNAVVNVAGALVSSSWPDSYGTGSPASNTLVRL